MEVIAAAAGKAALSVAFKAIFDKLSSQDFLKYARRNKVESEVNRWNNFLCEMKCVLDDAEERQMSEGRIKIWLDDLRDLAYDVEDILDEFSTELMHEKVMAETEASPSKVRKLIRAYCSCLSPRDIKFNVSLGSKMEKIAQRFERLTKEKEDLKLTESTTRISGGDVKWKLETTSLPESHVYGRETDKKTLITKLLSSDSNGEPFSVVAIVGMGGLGKTTLAQLLYNDDSVKTSFDIKAWVCVSDEFDVFKITVKILEEVNPSSCDANSLNKVQEKLRDTLQGKKFLLILDDVWNKNYSQWDALSRPLATGGLGSKVLITTRIEDVATTAGAGAVFMHHLNKLKPEECSSLLARHALGQNDFSRHPTLQEMGEEIAKKCDGLPLAAKAIGGLLRGKSNPKEWSTVLKSNMWELPQDECPILPALRLSYHYLPSHLKRCFAYCAIFPKDYPFDKDDLILWWMAEGFLEQSTDFMEVGDDYFKDLLSRSFFQRLTSDKDSKFVMHDLMNDLATWISGGICLHLSRSKKSASGMKFENLRHLSFMAREYEVTKRFEKFSSSTRLRTFIAFVKYLPDSFLSNVILDNLTLKMRCLKLLCLSGYEIQKLPDTISKLKQLRHLDMSFTKIRLLPESISGLLNLQILKLNNCQELIQLPREMMKLVNLQLLDISGTPKLEGMPSRIGRLTNLQILPKFIIGENHGLRLNELKGLSLIRGELSISRLENVVDIQDAIDANLKSKEGIVSLEFCWTEETRVVENEKEVQIFAELQPHTSLKSLEIIWYNGKHFPRWVGDCSFTNLETLTLHGCVSASSLPPLGGLISLKTLEIVGMHEVKKIGKEFWGNTSNSNHTFPSLETLILRKMNGLEEWYSGFGCGDEAEVVFPRLQKMYITDSPNLTNLPNQLPSLGELSIRKCPNLTNLPSHLPSLAELRIERCLNLTYLPNHLPFLGELRIEECRNLKNLPNQLPLLGVLSIDGCRNLTNLPNQLPLLRKLRIERCLGFTNLECRHPSLQKLAVTGCSAASVNTLGSLSSLKSLELENIKELICMNDGLLSMLGALQKLEIVSCPKLKTLVRNGKGIEGMVGLKRLKIEYCNELEALVGEGDQGLHCLPSLESLEIYGANKLVSFGPMRLPSSLKYMRISCCNALKCLPEGFMNMMDGSTPYEYALETLKIIECTSLTTFPGGRFPRQLVDLQIDGCTNLEIMPKFFDSIQSLKIFDCDRLQNLPRLSASLLSLKIKNLQSLALESTAIEIGSPISSDSENFQHQSPSLESIEIGYVEEMESGAEKMFDYCASSLENLYLGDLNWRRLPKNITSFQRMKSLEIWKCKNLRGLPKQMQELTCLRELTIAKCPNLELLAGRELPRELTKLDIRKCEKVIEGLFDGGLSILSSLTKLVIDGGEGCGVNIKQGSSAFLPKLQTLCISNLGNWESLATAFELSSLLSGLKYLSISNCPMLKKRFLDREREYLSLLSNIPKVEIDDEELC